MNQKIFFEIVSSYDVPQVIIRDHLKKSWRKNQQHTKSTKKEPAKALRILRVLRGLRGDHALPVSTLWVVFAGHYTRALTRIGFFDNRQRPRHRRNNH